MVLPATPPAGQWTWPVDIPVIEQAFAPPSTRYGAGHRGVDLATPPDAPVRALGSGQIAFIGEVAGIPVVTIDHGGIRSTYQPVSTSRMVGEAVSVGEVIGRTASLGGHCAGHCLHLGVIADDVYRDPLALLRRYAVLKPVNPR